MLLAQQPEAHLPLLDIALILFSLHSSLPAAADTESMALAPTGLLGSELTDHQQICFSKNNILSAA